VVSAVRPNLEEQQDLVEIAACAGNAAAVLLPAAAVGSPTPLGRRLTLDDAGWLHVEHFAERLRPRALEQRDAQAIMALLDLASRHDDVAPDELPTPDVRVPVHVASDEDDDQDDSREHAPGLASLAADVDVLVRVLGEVVAVREAGSPNEERLVPTRQKGLEAVVYLALREAAVDREDLEINLFPDGANAAKTVYNTISAARMLVGDDLFPAPEGGRYQLSRRVVTDYGLFCDLVASAEEADDKTEAAILLADALGLVRGEPFVGVGRGYAWVGPHRGMIVAQVVDAAEELGELRLATGDWRGAEWAARQGLRTFPSDERMYRLLMRTAHAAGNIPGVQRVFRELCDVIADPDAGVEPEDTLHDETVQLLEELTGNTRREHRFTA
jgi:DNA-binding SARP family transcriptional activator